MRKVERLYIIMPWFVYILRCSDLSYYVGHTVNPQQRVTTHNAGLGPVYNALVAERAPDSH